MAKLNRKWSKLKVFRSGEYEYIYIYFKLGGDMLRINTKNEYIKSYMNADLTYNSKMENYVELNRKTTLLQSKVERYISWQLNEHYPKVNQQDCVRFIKEGVYRTTTENGVHGSIRNKTLIEYFEDFYSYKQKELNNKPSVKDYLSLKNALIDFENTYTRTLMLKDLTKEFFIDFRYFLTIPHSKGSLTRGNLNDNTINKRITSLKTFMKYIEEERELFSFKKALYDFKTDTYENDVVALTKKELLQIKQLKIEKKHWLKIRDIFIFNCFVGLRYSDLRKMTKANIVEDEDGDWFIEMETQKTQIPILVPLQETSLKILEKYDYDLAVPPSQHFNREIKKIFEHYELLVEPIEKKRKQIKAVQTVSIPKWKLISSHTCRRTFITLAIGANVPLNAIMKATGHQKIQTVKKYMKLETDKKAFKGIDI